MESSVYPQKYCRSGISTLYTYWTAMPVKVDENYYFSAQYGGATTVNQDRSFGYNIRPVADR